MSTTHYCPRCGTVEPLLTLDEHAGAMQSDPTQSFHDLAAENATQKRQLEAAHELINAAASSLAEYRTAREKYVWMAVRVDELEGCLKAVMYVNTIGGDLRDRIAELLDRKADA